MRTFARVSLVAALTLPLTACVGGPTAELTPTPTTVESQAPEESPTPTATAILTDECHPWEFADPSDTEQVTGWKLQDAVDGGPTEYAMGKVDLDAAGRPTAYHVAQDDVYEFISARFCVNMAYLLAINSLRRKDQTLYPGDVINLDAHTILRIGSQGGVVYSNPPPAPIPPQR